MKFQDFGIKLLTVLLLWGMMLPLAADKVEAFVTPQPVRAGEEAYLVLRSNDGTRNLPLSRRLPEVPELSWQNGIRQSSQTRIINGRRSSVFEAYIPFVVSRPGSYTIPSMNLTHSRERTKKITFEAVEARYQTTRQPSRRSSGTMPADSSREPGMTPEQIMFMEMEIPDRKPFYYLGEEIPLEINIYIREGVRPQLSWPRITFGEKAGAVFRDYRQSNPENPNFAGMTQKMVERDGNSYTLCSFRTAVRPIAAGKLEISSKENAALIVRDDRRSRSADPFDEFFGDSFFSRSRQIARNMTAGPMTLEIRNLPPVPQGVWFTGLVGSWESQVTLSPPPYKVGEPITMKVEFQGGGSTDTLRTRPLELKGFRVYPPEVEKNAGGAEIRYVLIPTEPAEGRVDNVTFGPYAAFNGGNYTTWQFKRALMIEKGSAVIPGRDVSYSAEAQAAVTETPRVNAPEKRRAEDILYLKKTDGRGIPMPPEVNIGGGLLLILFGALFFIFAVIVRQVRRAREKDPAFQRRAAARGRRHELLSRLSKLPPEEIPGACSGDIASYLADVKGLAPGADLSECAAAVKVQSPELSRLLEELSQAAWMPSVKSRFTPEFRNALVKALGKVAVIVLLLGAVPLTAGESAGKDQAMTAYDTGKFDSAERYFRSKLNPAAPSANLLYNIGNCLFQQGYLPQALVCFERAAHLSPRDPDILENLNLTRRKLLLPEKYKVESPSDVPPYLRDSLRPDEWLFLLCCGIALLLVAGGMAVLRGNGLTFRILLCAGSLLIVISSAAYFSQQSSSYNPDFAVVTMKNLPVRSLPSDQAGKVEMKLREGEEVMVVERRMDWVRIRSGTAEGWVHAKGIASLWNPDGAGDL